MAVYLKHFTIFRETMRDGVFLLDNFLLLDMYPYRRFLGIFSNFSDNFRATGSIRTKNLPDAAVRRCSLK